jgi:lysozyme
MDVSQRGIDLIVASEGKKTLLPDGRYQAYLDKLAAPHVWTIYCGLTKGVYEGMTCTEEEGNRLFGKECSVYEDAIERLVSVPLNQNQFDALVSFVYNCGVGALQNSTLLKLLNQGKYEQVPAQLMRWTHAGGVQYPGLVTRRRAEGALFMEPMPDVAVEPIPQRVEEAPAATVREAIGTSSSIKIVAVAAPGAAVTWWDTLYNWTFGLVGQAGAEIVETQKMLTPFSAILKLTPSILVTITLGCLVAVAVRQYVKRRNGTAV